MGFWLSNEPDLVDWCCEVGAIVPLVYAGLMIGMGDGASCGRTAFAKDDEVEGEMAVEDVIANLSPRLARSSPLGY